MNLKSFSPIRLLYFFISLFFYFVNIQPPTTTISFSKMKYKFSIPQKLENIQENSFLIIDVLNNLPNFYLLKKCIKYGNVVFLSVNDFKSAEIFYDLGLTKLKGIFYFKNKDEIFDVKNFEKCTKKNNNFYIWDILILSKFLQFRFWVKKLIICHFEIDVLFYIINKFLY